MIRIMIRIGIRNLRTFQHPPARSLGIAVWRFLFVTLLLTAFPVRAHVGNPVVFFEGHAGPYPLRVTIQPPGVVPGLAQIHIRLSSSDIEKVTVLPVRWNAGTRGAPPADVAKPVPGETNLLTAQLWLMDSGAYSVFVDVFGSHGRGTAIVPLDSLAYQRLGMPRWMAFTFLAAGVGVVWLLVSLVGAAARESVLAPGEQPAVIRRRKGALAMVVTALISVGFVAFGKSWWDKVDRDYRYNRLYHPEAVRPEIKTGADGLQQLALHIKFNHGRMESTPLAPEHGHLMHLFLIRQPAGDVFAHLHPLRHAVEDEDVFTVALPGLPAGDYQLFADVTHESGLTQTLTNLVHLPGAANTNESAYADADDSIDRAAPGPPGDRMLPGQLRLTPAFPATFRANEDTTLRFNITTTNGQPAILEPYLGMYGHLIIERDDGTIFNHLHPLGTISMTAQRLFAQREQAGYLANQPLDQFCSAAEPILSFPYAFPEPGRYRLWLQTKLQGRICTAGYTVAVQ
jgi:hypothetical protein